MQCLTTSTHRGARAAALPRQLELEAGAGRAGGQRVAGHRAGHTWRAAWRRSCSVCGALWRARHRRRAARRGAARRAWRHLQQLLQRGVGLQIPAAQQQAAEGCEREQGRGQGQGLQGRGPSLAHAVLLGQGVCCRAHLLWISARRSPCFRLPTNRFLTAWFVRPGGSSAAMACQWLPCSFCACAGQSGVAVEHAGQPGVEARGGQRRGWRRQQCVYGVAVSAASCVRLHLHDNCHLPLRERALARMAHGGVEVVAPPAGTQHSAEGQ